MSKIAVVGLGLIGGSLVKLIHKKHPSYEIYACDLNIDAVKEAHKEGLIQNQDISISSLPKECSLVFVSVPIEHTEALVMESLSHFNVESVVVDCASVKKNIVGAMSDPRFVGGHPVAGSEHTGFAHSDADILEGATFVLCPSLTNERAVETASAMLRDISFNLLFLSPESHDEMLAMSSHFPYVMASVVAQLTEDNTPLKSVVGTGFMSTTRVASTSPKWGAEVVLENKAAVKSLINQTKLRLDSLEKALDEDDRDTLFEFFESAKNQRDELID